MGLKCKGYLGVRTEKVLISCTGGAEKGVQTGSCTKLYMFYSEKSKSMGKTVKTGSPTKYYAIQKNISFKTAKKAELHHRHLFPNQNWREKSPTGGHSPPDEHRFLKKAAE